MISFKTTTCRVFCIAGCLYLLAAHPPVAKSETLRTFVSDFQREFVNRGQKETISGRVFYDVNLKKLLIRVDQPLRQWMVLEGRETIIYYPDKKQAFRIKTQIEAVMPFFQVFIGCVEEDFGLGRLGYAMAGYEKKGMSLTSNWTPPKNMAKNLGDVVLVYESNRLVSAEYKTPKGAPASKGTFGRHIPFGGYFFPLEISIESKYEGGSTTEKVAYVNPEFNGALPEDVRAFKLPPGVMVKDVEW